MRPVLRVPVGRRVEIGRDDDGAAVVEVERPQPVEERPHGQQRAACLTHVTRPGQTHPPTRVSAVCVRRDRWMGRDHVQERVQWGFTPCLDPIGEIPQERRVCKSPRRAGNRPPKRRGPLLQQPRAVAIDVGLDAVRCVPEQRQIQQLGRRAVEVGAVAAVRSRNSVFNGVLGAGERRAGMIAEVGGRRPEPVPVLPERVEDGGMRPSVGRHSHVVAIRDAGEHRRHAGQRRRKGAQVIPVESESGPRAIRRWRGRRPKSVDRRVARLEGWLERVRLCAAPDSGAMQ